MEETKKQQIIQTAMAVFKDKGYFSASMKEIADACGMAKGSIYKIFPSKEDLFTEVFEACHQTMFEKAKELDRQQENVIPKEKLRKKIEFLLQYMLENHFFTSEFKELPIKDNEKFIQAWKKKRATLLTLHRDCFYEAYGESIKDCIWDVVTIFRGMQREYLSYAHQQAIALPMSELALFIVERMDAVVNDMVHRNAAPVLKENNVYLGHINSIDLQTHTETLHDFLQFFTIKIHELKTSEKLRQELLEVITLLQKELKREEPNKTLVHVFTTYLEQTTELIPYVRQLKLMI